MIPLPYSQPICKQALLFIIQSSFPTLPLYSPSHDPYHALSHHTIFLDPTEEFFPHGTPNLT